MADEKTAAEKVFERGRSDCVQDSMENAPFASTGGLVKRVAMTAPAYVPEHDHEEYLRGYRWAAEKAYGADWQTCAFGWVPALTLGGEKG
jgi:hypothetical protein